MIAFDLNEIRHGLFVKSGKVRARVLGRMFPTVETEAGRAAIAPSALADWLAEQGLQVEPRRVLQARLAAEADS